MERLTKVMGCSDGTKIYDIFHNFLKQITVVKLR